MIYHILIKKKTNQTRQIFDYDYFFMRQSYHNDIYTSNTASQKSELFMYNFCKTFKKM